MRAVVLAGGRGARLAPYTTVVPKPLLPVGDLPILEIVIRQLARAGFDHITLTLGHLSEYVAAFLDHRPSLRALARIDTVVEERPTGTAGSLAAVAGLGDAPFLVMNGDLLTTIDYRAVHDAHLASGADLTIAVHDKPVQVDLGVLEVGPDGAVADYIEKPTLRYTVSTGVYVYSPCVLGDIEPGSHLDFPDLVLRLVRRGRPVRAFRSDGFWLDLGRREDLERATAVFAERRAEFLGPEPEPGEPAP